MEPRNILSIIRSEVSDFLNNSIEIVPGYTFNQYETIKQSHLYLNSKFVDQSFYQGKEKMFDNKIKPKRDRVVAFLNVDTKDVKAISNNGSDNPYKVLVAQKELEYHMKENDYAQKFNDMTEAAVDFGSVVIKQVRDGDEIVDLRRFFCDPTVANLQKSRFIIFKHLFTISELREKAKKENGGWDAKVIEDIIAWKERQGNTGNAGMSYEQNGQLNMIGSTPYIEVYERMGEVEEGMLRGNNSRKIIRSLYICAEPMRYSQNEKGEYLGEEGGILFKSAWKGDYPVDEYHYLKVMGRWLGVGVPEALFIPQERINELVNQKRISMELSTLHLFQSQGNSVVSNVLTDLQNGDLLITGPNGTISPVVNEERNLAAFNSEEQYYAAAIDSLSFISQEAAGSASPSSTPATNSVIQQNNVTSVMNFKRQNYCNFLRRYLRKFVLPKLLKEIKDEHIIRFVGDYNDTLKLNLAVATSYATQQAHEKVLGGTPVSDQDFQQMVQTNLQALKGRTELHLEVEKGWYDDVDLDFDILIDNEQQSTDVIANNTWQVIQALSANPQALENPVIRALIFDYCEKVGINPSKLEGMDMSQGQQPQQQMQQPQQGAQMGTPQMQQPSVGQGAGDMSQVRQPATV